MIRNLWGVAPVMTRNMLETGLVDAAFNESLTNAAVMAFDRYIEQTASSKPSGGRRRKTSVDQPVALNPDKPTPNDHFFEHQRSRGYSIMSSSSPELCLLRDSLLMDSSSEYLKNCGTPDGLLQQLGVLYSIDVWAAVQRGKGAYHRDHVHEDVLVSGVYYAAVPDGSAPLVLQRPTEYDEIYTSGEDDGESYEISPQPGQLVLFPPWLWHGVPPVSSNCSEEPRVSFAFNLSGPYRGDPWKITKGANRS
jgi:hypothetical protein